MMYRDFLNVHVTSGIHKMLMNARLGDIDLKVGFKGEVRRINVSDTWKKKINYSLIHAICIMHEDDLGCLCKTWTTQIV